jgi:ABC-type polysaccharide/polyol phosphate transport system ATPase subunit
MALIEVAHVTKEFQLGQPTSLREVAANALRRLAGGAAVKRQSFLALDDVTLSIEQGEVLGIIGNNGAGKSTLLKLLANITCPTRGRVAVRGRVSPLISVGAGLVWELTGRENIFLNGTILGMPRKEIARKFDEIVAFAELADFIDTPVKRYSSGMQVRLGFSVATAVSAEILIVDEVLAVGDLAFQKKCYDRMDDLIHRQQRTVLIVGHNIRQLERFCSRMILMDHGRVELDGDATEVCNRFHHRTAQRTATTRRTSDPIAPQAGTGEITIESVELFSGDDVQARADLPMDQDLRIRIALVAASNLHGLSVDIGIHTADFVFVTRTSTSMLAVRPDLPAGRHVIECSVDRIALNPDSYGLGITIRDRYDRIVWQGANVMAFSVVHGAVDRNRLPVHAALLYLPFTWSIPSLQLWNLRCDVVTEQSQSVGASRPVQRAGNAAAQDPVGNRTSSDGAKLHASSTTVERP